MSATNFNQQRNKKTTNKTITITKKINTLSSICSDGTKGAKRKKSAKKSEAAGVKKTKRTTTK